jgi:hypothetical protein
VLLASRGLRDMDQGSEKISDAGELGRVRAQATKVYIESAGLALVLTGLVMIVPPR